MFKATQRICCLSKEWHGSEKIVNLSIETERWEVENPKKQHFPAKTCFVDNCISIHFRKSLGKNYF